MASLYRVVCEDVDDFSQRLAQWTVDPVQLTSGALRIGFSSLAFEDLAVSRLESNQQVADRLHMDSSWLLVVVQLTPQRWSGYEAPPSSLTVVAPGSDYRSLVFPGFRCVEAAVRVDLAEAIGLGHWLGLTGAEAIFPLPVRTTLNAEHWVTQSLLRQETEGLLQMDDATAAVREECVRFVRWLGEVVHPSLQGNKERKAGLVVRHFDLVRAALQIIDSAPADQQLSVTELARILQTTRRTLVNAFADAVGTPPSRYLLARRLNFARRSLESGVSPSVTDAAFEFGFEHLGRFSQHYRKLFGELPSQTLHRADRVSMAAGANSAH